jgi:hypothetical protein
LISHPFPIHHSIIPDEQAHMITRIVRPWLRLPRIYHQLPNRLEIRFFRRTIQTSSGRPRHTQPPEDALFDHELEERDDEDVEGFEEYSKYEEDSEHIDTSRSNRPKPKHWVDGEIMRAAKREVVWLMADKVSLAKRIETAVNDGQLKLAETITRLASRGPEEAVVAWNLLIKSQMDHTVPHYDVAIKYYNEVCDFPISNRGFLFYQTNL